MSESVSSATQSVRHGMTTRLASKIQPNQAGSPINLKSEISYLSPQSHHPMPNINSSFETYDLFSSTLSSGFSSSTSAHINIQSNLSRTFDTMTRGFPKFSGLDRDWKTFSRNIAFALAHLGLTELSNGPFRILVSANVSLEIAGKYDTSNNKIFYISENMIPDFRLYSHLMYALLNNLIGHDLGIMAIANQGEDRPFTNFSFFACWQNLVNDFNRRSLLGVATILDTWMNFRQGSLPFNSFIGQYDNFVKNFRVSVLIFYRIL
jgi:hypothetical protein